MCLCYDNHNRKTLELNVKITPAIISWLNRSQKFRLTPLASTPEQSRAARRVHTASIPWQLRCCSQPSRPLVDIITYSVCRFPATVTNTKQMPKTMVIPEVAVMA